MAVYCTKCGAANADGAGFCQACGAAMGAVAPPAALPAPAAVPVPPPGYVMVPANAEVRKGMHPGVIVAIVVGVLFVIGILAAIAIPMFMKFVHKSKAGEARLNLSKIATLADYYYTKSASLGSSSMVELGPGSMPLPSFGTNPRITSSCDGPDCNEECVPREARSVSGLKYQPSERDWMGNDYADPTAWSKIHFIITQPIQFQYCYAARGEGENAEFEVVAFGDVDGDGVFSEYRRMGRIIGGQVVIGPIAVVNESE